MSQGPEHLDRNSEDQLNAFKTRLGPPVRAKRPLPGFLFRDGVERNLSYTIIDFLNEASTIQYDRSRDLLSRHAETYRRGLEARALLLDRIRPVETLEAIRDEIWGKGKVERTDAGATLTYPSYPVATEEWASNTYRERDSSVVKGYAHETRGGSFKTGKWLVGWANDHHKMSVDVNFGNIKHPDPNDLKEGSGFFVDYCMPLSSPSASLDVIDFSPIPQDIWRRPDNLVVVVKSLRFNQQGGYYTGLRGAFAPPTSRQEYGKIIECLCLPSEESKAVGQHPSQLEALELAKIEELRKRGLLIESSK